MIGREGLRPIKKEYNIDYNKSFYQLLPIVMTNNYFYKNRPTGQCDKIESRSC